jgi:Uma2 family endonuclease
MAARRSESRWTRCTAPPAAAPGATDDDPLVPDRAIELASPTDRDDNLHAKMREWRDCGVRLGWLIPPDSRQVWRNAPAGEGEPVCLDNPQQLGDDDLLPGLALPLGHIWEPGL